MIVPKDVKLFAIDEVPFREKMVEYIKVHFADDLGEDVKLLDQPDGLEKLSLQTRQKLDRLRKAA